MKKLLLAAIISVGFAGPALSSSCPAIMAKIEEAMKVTKVDDATKAKAMELLTKGKAEHEAGSHDASVASLNEAVKLLGM